MHMELFLHPREKEAADYYPDVPREQVKHAEEYLNLIISKSIKSGNPDFGEKEATEQLSKLKKGELGEGTIQAHHADYLESMNS